MADAFAPVLATNQTSMVFTVEGVLSALACSTLILLIILIPYLYELYCAYQLARERDKNAQTIFESTVKDFMSRLKMQGSITDEQLSSLYDRVFTPIQETMKQPVSGITGSTRGIIAFAIIYTVGVATMLVLFAKSGDSQLVNNVVSMLAATLATIIGFYFGGRTVQETTAAANEAAKTNAQSSSAAAAPPPSTKTPERTLPAEPVIKANGIAVAAIRMFDKDWIPTPLPGLNIYDSWSTLGSKSLEVSMAENCEYTLYCNVESSVPQGEYDIYIEPSVKKESETKPFLYYLHDYYTPMIPHLTIKTRYVQFFEWIPKYKNWREPGEYHVTLKLGYLKRGTQGKEPIWLGIEEFKVTIKKS
jgi:uncharacterized protein involved in tolerance to divalent cations